MAEWISFEKKTSRPMIGSDVEVLYNSGTGWRIARVKQWNCRVYPDRDPDIVHTAQYWVEFGDGIKHWSSWRPFEKPTALSLQEKLIVAVKALEKIENHYIAVDALAKINNIEDNPREFLYSEGLDSSLKPEYWNPGDPRGMEANVCPACGVLLGCHCEKET